MDEKNNIPLTQISQNLSTLMDFLRSNNPLMLVVGEKESGKTRLLSTVIAKMRVARHIIRIKGGTRVSAAQVIKLFAKNWSVPIKKSSEERLDQQLTNILHSIIEHEHACILVIDDAHLLPFSVLGAILHLAILQEQQKVYLHLILSGTPELEEKISCMWPHEITKLTLGRLSREQVYEDIKERLAAQQYMPAPSLLERIVNHVYEQTNGLPESVNRMVNTLIGQFPTKQPIKKLNRSIARKRLVQTFSLMSLLIFGIFIWWFYQSPYQVANKQKINLAQVQHKVKHTHTPAPIIGQVILQANAIPNDQAWMAAATAIKSNPITVPPTNFVPTKVLAQAKIQTPQIMPSSPTNSAISNDQAWMAAATAIKSNPISVPPTNFVPTKVLAQTKIQTPKLKPSSPTNNVISNDQAWMAAVTAIKSNPISVQSTNFVPTKDLAQAKIQTPQIKPSSSTNSVEPSKYTLQLMGSKHPAALKLYVEKHHLEKMANIIHTYYKNNDWYILAYGKYNSVKQANSAYKKLPKPLKKLHPWIRPVNGRL